VSREQKAKQIRSAILRLVSGGSGLFVNEIRIVLALERIVARLASDPKLDSHLVYKGGFVLLKTLASHRFTRDLDALGLSLNKADIEALVPASLLLDLDDGFWFGDVQMETIDTQGEYGALR
jgi:hypothetical protein